MIETWTTVDGFIEAHLVGADPVFDATLARSDEAGLMPISVSASQGKLLHILSKSIGARRILEVGTLGGYSALWLARALPRDGELITLEINPQNAEVARANLAAASLTARVEVRVGPAIDILPTLEGPFDLAFIDANKDQNPEYFTLCLERVRPGGLIIVDNVVRDGGVIDRNSPDPAIQGVRRLFDVLALESRVTATAIQTVGSKGYDGFAIAWVH